MIIIERIECLFILSSRNPSMKQWAAYLGLCHLGILGLVAIKSFFKFKRSSSIILQSRYVLFTLLNSSFSFIGITFGVLFHFSLNFFSPSFSLFASLNRYSY